LTVLQLRLYRKLSAGLHGFDAVKHEIHDTCCSCTRSWDN
jgi:hypothetical protein